MVERISHFGIVVHDLDAAVKLWTQTYGLAEFRRLDIPAEGIRSVLLSPRGTAGEMAIELMQPTDPSDMSNAVARRLARAGEGFYHVALEVDDVEGSGRALAERGMTVFERAPAAPGDAMRWVVHPRDSNGVLVELIQSRRVTR
jgi:methylmalonyl-CoA/ethylmalonyl-CoA epimerase